MSTITPELDLAYIEHVIQNPHDFEELKELRILEDWARGYDIVIKWVQKLRCFLDEQQNLGSDFYDWFEDVFETEEFIKDFSSHNFFYITFKHRQVPNEPILNLNLIEYFIAENYDIMDESGVEDYDKVFEILLKWNIKWIRLESFAMGTEEWFRIIFRSKEFYQDFIPLKFFHLKKQI